MEYLTRSKDGFRRIRRITESPLLCLLMSSPHLSKVEPHISLGPRHQNLAVMMRALRSMTYRFFTHGMWILAQIVVSSTSGDGEFGPFRKAHFGDRFKCQLRRIFMAYVVGTDDPFPSSLGSTTDGLRVHRTSSRSISASSSAIELFGRRVHTGLILPV